MRKSTLLKIASVTVSLIGFYLMIKSPILGANAANEYLRVEMFGSMDTDSFNIMQQSFIDAYRWSGSILLVVGSFYAFQFLSKRVE